MRDAVLVENDTLDTIKILSYCLGMQIEEKNEVAKAGGRMWLLRAQFHLTPVTAKVEEWVM